MKNLLMNEISVNKWNKTVKLLERFKFSAAYQVLSSGHQREIVISAAEGMLVKNKQKTFIKTDNFNN